MMNMICVSSYMELRSDTQQTKEFNFKKVSTTN